MPSHALTQHIALQPVAARTRPSALVHRAGAGLDRMVSAALTVGVVRAPRDPVVARGPSPVVATRGLVVLRRHVHPGLEQTMPAAGPAEVPARPQARHRARQAQAPDPRGGRGSARNPSRTKSANFSLWSTADARGKAGRNSPRRLLSNAPSPRSNSPFR